METRKFGYIRCSTKEQNEARQIEALINFGISERDLYIDKASGKNFDREQYQLMLRNIRKGDLVVFLSLDRMGRNYSEIQEQWKHITTTLEADIKILDMELLDTRSEDNSLDRRFICDLVLQILAYVAEKERLNIKERQRQGIKIALENGTKFGRRNLELPDEFYAVASLYRKQKISAKEAIEQLGMKRSTFYKKLNEQGV